MNKDNNSDNIPSNNWNEWSDTIKNKVMLEKKRAEDKNSKLLHSALFEFGLTIPLDEIHNGQYISPDGVRIKYDGHFMYISPVGYAGGSNMIGITIGENEGYGVIRFYNAIEEARRLAAHFSIRGELDKASKTAEEYSNYLDAEHDNKNAEARRIWREKYFNKQTVTLVLATVITVGGAALIVAAGLISLL